jgi:hypothetical protein
MMPIGNIISKGIGLLFLFYFTIFHVFWLKKQIYVNKEFTFIVIWFFFCIVSGLFSLEIELVYSKLVTILQLILFFIAGYSVILKGKITENQVFYTFIISTIIVILYGVATYEPISGFEYKNRIASTTGNPNNLAVFGSFAYVFCLYLIGTQRKILKRVFLSILLLIILYGIINTHSRQGIVILLGSTIIYGIIRIIHNYKNNKNKVTFIRNGVFIVISLAVFSIIGYQFVSESAYYFRIKTLVSFLKIGINSNTVNMAKIVDYSAYERSQFIIYGIRIWMDNLFFGVGLDNFRVIIKQYWPISNPLYSHNNYVELFSTIGTFGALAYYAIYYLIIKRLVTLLKIPNLSSNSINLIHIFLTSIFSLMILELVTVSYYRKYTWVILLVIIGFTERMFLHKKLPA